MSIYSSIKDSISYLIEAVVLPQPLAELILDSDARLKMLWKDYARDELNTLKREKPDVAQVVESAFQAFKSAKPQQIESKDIFHVNSGGGVASLCGYSVLLGNYRYYIAEKSRPCGDISFSSYVIGVNAENAPAREGMAYENKWFEPNSTEWCGLYLHKLVYDKIKNFEEKINKPLRDAMFKGLTIIKESPSEKPYPLTLERTLLSLPDETGNKWEYIMRGMVTEAKVVPTVGWWNLGERPDDGFEQSYNRLLKIKIGNDQFSILAHLKEPISLGQEIVIHAQLQYPTKWNESAQFIDGKVLAN